VEESSRQLRVILKEDFKEIALNDGNLCIILVANDGSGSATTLEEGLKIKNTSSVASLQE
jgi:hypothetical protein